MPRKIIQNDGVMSVITPKPLLDTTQAIIEQYKDWQHDQSGTKCLKDWLEKALDDSRAEIPTFAIKDYGHALTFLYSYRGSEDTLNAYRREIERFLQWSWFIRGQSFLKHKRADIEAYIEFFIRPPKRWIGLKTVARFKDIGGERKTNKDWRPFVAKIRKAETQQGKTATKDDYQCSQATLKVMLNILSSFYHYLLQEEIAATNPVMLIRQKSKFLRKEAKNAVVRRLSPDQWQTVIEIAKEKAQTDVKYERDVFILSCLYGMYLRISELVATKRWTPTTGDFSQDADGNWWFQTVSKGNKARQIAVSDAMLNALKHYRETYLNLPPYPVPGEKMPLIPHANNRSQPISHDCSIRELVQHYFHSAANRFEALGQTQDADILRTATVHWLRHTGISDDVKQRPREHVRDDAGHSSSAITDRYIDIELTERAKSAKKKRIDRDI